MKPSEVEIGMGYIVDSYDPLTEKKTHWVNEYVNLQLSKDKKYIKVNYGLDSTPQHADWHIVEDFDRNSVVVEVFEEELPASQTGLVNKPTPKVLPNASVAARRQLQRRLRQMNLSKATVIYIDFETYWATDFTLSKMPTQAYIMDARFYAHGACIAVNEGKIVWITHVKLYAVLTSLAAKYPNAIWVAHNALFDMSILSYIYDIHPRFVIDTAGVSRALIGPHLRSHSLDNMAQFLLGEEKGKTLILSKGVEVLDAQLERTIAEYCTKDVDLMRRSLAFMAPHFPAQELPVMTWVTQMMTEPKIVMDEGKLIEYNRQVVEKKENILFELGIDKAELMSNDKFALLLMNMDVLPPRKIRPKFVNDFVGASEEDFLQALLDPKISSWAFAKTDAGLKDLLEHDDENVQALVGARLEVKSTIEETRSATYANLSQYNPVGVPLAYSGAIPTHRFSGRDKLNFQNLKRGGTIRDCIIAPEQCAFIVSDLAQIELRIVLVLAAAYGPVEFLGSGGDLYWDFATRLFGLGDLVYNKEDKEHKGMRQISKSAVLGLGFGMGAKKYRLYCAQMGIKIDEELAQSAVDLYRGTYVGVPKLWRIMEAAYKKLLREQQPFDLQLGGYLAHFGFDPLCGAPGCRLPSGLWIKYPELSMDEDRQWAYNNGGVTTKIFGGHFVENLVQALARVVITEKSVRIHKRFPVVMSTHDELVAVVEFDDFSELDDASNFVHEHMLFPVDWMPRLILGAETNSGYRYGEIK